MVTQGIREHFRGFFETHPCKEHIWSRGPAIRDLPDLRILEFAPGLRTRLWVYATVGASDTHTDRRLEFVIAAPMQDTRQIELAAMTAWYHLSEKLELGHTFPIGRAWLPGSSCTSMLVSLPYPFGPELERCRLSDGDVRVLWLLPITEAEKQYRNRAGLEALEQKFDAARLEYWRPDRASVVPAGSA